MESLLAPLGITVAELTQLVILAVVLLFGLFFLRVAFKMTMSLLRVGCAGVLLIVAAGFIFYAFA